MKVERVWVEEFGGGGWVEYPVCVASSNADAVAREALHNALYGPGYQAPEGTRSTTGTWTEYPGL